MACGVVASAPIEVTREQALTELNTIAVQLVKMSGEKVELRVGVTPLQETIVAGSRRGLLMLLSAVGCVLLIDCVNLANLTCIATAALGLQAMLHWAPTDIPRLHDASLDGRVLLVALVLTGTTGLLTGFAAAWRAAHAHPQHTLQASGRTVTTGRGGRHLRAGLVIAGPQDCPFFYIRSTGSPVTVVGAVRRLMRELDLEVEMSGLQTMDDLVNEQLLQERTISHLVGLFSLLALGVACCD